MKAIVQILGLSLVVFIVGFLAGVGSSNGGKYQAGRLSACQEMVKLDPILAIAQVTCITRDGDVALQVGDKVYSLKGEVLN